MNCDVENSLLSCFARRLLKPSSNVIKLVREDWVGKILEGDQDRQKERWYYYNSVFVEACFENQASIDFFQQSNHLHRTIEMKMYNEYVFQLLSVECH